MSKSPIEIGRLLRSSLTGFVAGCRVNQSNLPTFGSLVWVPINTKQDAFGLVYDIHMDDDGLVRQLATSQTLPPEVIADNRNNRNMPVEISIVTIGQRQEGVISHLLPGHPPISLDLIYQCSSDEIRAFTKSGRFGYFRHILRNQDLPIIELLTAHLQQARQVHYEGGDPTWFSIAVQELIILLRDDYPNLMGLVNALSDLPLE